jgi:ABC-type dipeptide/oligopeptide/nickel transport system permease subunit
VGVMVVALFVVIGLIWGSLAGLFPRSRGNG